MLISITLFALIVIAVFDAFWNITIIRTKLINKLDINQDLYYAIEKLTSEIKDFGWDIDYEEYWNRQAVWTNSSSGYYDIFSWYGNYWSWWDLWRTSPWVVDPPMPKQNYWSWFYFCRSYFDWTNGQYMWTWGCLSDSNFNNVWSDMTWIPQRYWEYAFQFYDLNSNINKDMNWSNCIWDDWITRIWEFWDEDCNWNIKWDDDDENLWDWPLAFSGSQNEVKELYLYKNWIIQERMLIRRKVIRDPDAPASFVCNSWVWSWCLGKLQILKLVWKDYWFDHDFSSWSIGLYDGLVDTWWCHNDYNCHWVDNLPNSLDDWWIDLLPPNINVKDLKLFIYPAKNYRYAWKSDDPNITINPIIRINIALWYSRERRKKLRGSNPVINIATSINLTKE